jgi:hypothetical protein
MEQRSVAASEQAIITNLDESFRQDVLEETADEFFSGDGGELELLGCGIFVLEGDFAIFEIEDTVIADGDAKDVRSEVLEGSQTAADRFAMNDPVFVPDPLID